MKKLQKEVEKMAKMMQAVEDEFDEDENDEEKEEAEDEEEEVEESEPESEESESDEDSESETESQSEAEVIFSFISVQKLLFYIKLFEKFHLQDAEDKIKKDNLEPRVKQHEGRLNSLKKGNYLLEANAERLKDELKELKEKCNALQADLDSVIDLC
jgi:cobalamin biosynthesis protein CobT